MIKLDTMNEQSSWGGKREGAGRQQGSLGKATLEKKKEEAYLLQRILKNTDALFNAQLRKGLGEAFVYRVEKIGDGTKQREVHVIVEDPEEIKAFLDGEHQEEYHYIATKPADVFAIDSLINRAYGKPRQGVDVDMNVKTSLPPAEVIPLLERQDSELYEHYTSLQSGGLSDSSVDSPEQSEERTRGDDQL